MIKWVKGCFDALDRKYVSLLKYIFKKKPFNNSVNHLEPCITKFILHRCMDFVSAENACDRSK